MRGYFRSSAIVAMLLMGGSASAWAGDVTAGKAIFDKDCSFCHSDDGKGKLGPALHGISQRRDAAWLDRWLENPRKMMETDDYAKQLKEHNKYNMTMPAIPDMKDKANREAVIAYLMATF